MLDTEQVAGDGGFLATANKEQERGSSALVAQWSARKRIQIVLLCSPSILDSF